MKTVDSKIDPRLLIVFYLALGALTWVAFARALGNDFVNYDDQNYVYQNPAITGGLGTDALRWAFTHIHAQNWHPLTTLSHMLDCELFGLAPRGHHFTNIFLHTCTVLLLFHALVRFTGAPCRSAFAAAVFAIHPLRVESVAWIAERKDVLSGVCFTLTLIAYAAYADRRTVARYLVVTVAFALGLLSKPMLVTLPLVLLLLDYWPLGRMSSLRHTATWLALEKIPLLLLSAASSYATLLAQKQYIGSGEELSLGTRAINAALSYAIYLRQMFWPVGLVPFYPHREHSVTILEVIGAFTVLVVITIGGIIWRKRAPYLLVGWLWYLGMLVPVIGIVQVGWQGHADRYTYLPQIGIDVALTWLAADLIRRYRVPRSAVVSAAAMSIVAFASLAFAQVSYWRDSETLWKHTLAVTPENDVAENNLGIVLLAQGHADEALSHYEAALKLRPDNAVAHANLANVLISRGELTSSIAHLQRALELEPANPDAGNLLGFVLLREGNVGAAISQWTATLTKNPENGNARGNLAWIYATHPDASVRNGTEAVRLAREAANISGGRNALVLRTLAAAYAENGDFSDAIATARKARDLAEAQKNSALATELDATIRLYETGKPLRDPSLAQPPNGP